MYQPRKIPDNAKRLTIIAIGPQSLKFLAAQIPTVQQAVVFPTNPKARKIPAGVQTAWLR